ncbi:hypothetical protein M3Y94_00876100 [Aphelenchoides besseyi]|nr:hypothetical protein M3Y94_00876100 [Aphelenchoides besseyi]KAI6226606.1 hypothetical protein M3Y95_00638500 [Aphelenchoides besseyi]
MVPSRRRSKGQHQTPPRNQTVEVPEQQNEVIEANRTEFRYNDQLDGLSEGLKVEPKILVVHPKRTWKRLIYLSNISNDRQYFKFYSTHAKNFGVHNHGFLEPGETIAQEINFRSFKFDDKSDIAISIYHSRNKNSNLLWQHDNAHTVVVKLLKTRSTDAKELEKKSGSQFTSSIVLDGSGVSHLNASTSKLEEHTDEDDLNDL